MLSSSAISVSDEPQISTVLVTGGAGYIGSHTCLELLASGYRVIVIDNFSNSTRTALERVSELSSKTLDIHEVDLIDQSALFQVFSEYYDEVTHTCSIDAVIHFAGLKAVGESVREPLEYYHVNIVGTLNLLKMMEIFSVSRLVFSSSATVYGNCPTIPIHEDCPLSTLSPYGRTKLFNEQIISDAMIKTGGRAINLRYFNPIGAHPSGRLGEDPRGQPNNLMPFMAQVAVGLRSHIDVYGSDYATPDGTGVRDYLHIMDLARGHVLALERIDECVQPGGTGIYNLGTGQGHSVLEMIEAFSKAVGKPILYKIVGRRDGDVSTLVADAQKAKMELGFTCRYGIDQMCSDLWRWQSSHPNGYPKRGSSSLSSDRLD